MVKIFALLFYFLCVLAPESVAQESVIKNEQVKNIKTTVENPIEQNELSAVVKSSTTVGASTIKEPSAIVPLPTSENPPQVGKHVMANMDASSMILSLLMVLALIIISAMLLKRFNLTQQGSNQLSVVASLSLGTKERIMVVQVGEQQLVLGVCPQQISLLKDLETPIDTQLGKSVALSKNVLSFLQKNTVNAKSQNKP
jgi:flagellar protein FliO/FliZ